MNTEERQLAEMLHRVTPEPPRRVTVEDVAFRLANEAGRAGRDGRRGYREPRPRRGFSGSRGWNRGWAPALAAASVFVVAGASAGIAVALTSHHSKHPPTSSQDGYPPSTSPASTPASVTTSVPQPHPVSTAPSWPPERIASGMWGAELINRDAFSPASLVAGGGSLYAFTENNLTRIDPLTGEVINEASYTSPIPNFPNRPVVTGRTVWALSSYAGNSIVLTGYDGLSLGQVASVTVPASGSVTSSPQGVLTSGSGGYLYVATGNGVAVVNPSTRQVIKRISVPGQVTSVAVAPDGSKLYVSTGSLRVLRYNPATGAQLGSSTMAGFGGPGGNLVATSGGVWGTVGVGMTARVWFAPGGDLGQLVVESSGAGAGLYSIPASGGAAVWIGGSQKLVCANPATGQVMASTPIPTDKSIVEYFGSVAVTGSGRTYALYQNQAAQQSGVATLTPPARCSG